MGKISVKKKELKDISENFKNEFSENISDIAGKIERGLLTGLLVTGVAYISYKFLGRAFNDEEKEDSVHPSSKQENRFTQVTKFIGEAIAVFLLNLAKEELLKYLQERKNNATEDKNTSKGN